MCEKEKAGQVPIVGVIKDGHLYIKQEVDKHLADMFIEMEKRYSEQEESLEKEKDSASNPY